MNIYLQIILSTLAVYLFIIIAIRISGKKELSQLSVVDLVFIMLISNAVQNAMVVGDNSIYGGLAAAATLFITNAVFKRVFYNHKKLSSLVQGDPVMLIHGGKILETHLRNEKISQEELLTAAREHGVATLEEVDLAVLETDGSISILSKSYYHKTRRKRPSKNLLPGPQQ